MYSPVFSTCDTKTARSASQLALKFGSRELAVKFKAEVANSGANVEWLMGKFNLVCATSDFERQHAGFVDFSGHSSRDVSEFATCSGC